VPQLGVSPQRLPPVAYTLTYLLRGVRWGRGFTG